MRSLWQHHRPRWGIVLSGIFMTLVFPPFNWSWLLWIVFIPWFMSLARLSRLRDAFVQGVWLSFFLNLGCFSWIAATLHEFGNVPWPLAILGLLLFGLISQPQLPAVSLLFYWWKKRAPAPWYEGRFLPLMAVGISAWYVAADWTLPKQFYNTMGHGMINMERLRQVADIGGPLLLTLLIGIVNFALWRLLEESLRRDWRKAVLQTLPTTALGLVLVVLAMTYGHFRLQFVRDLLQRPKATLQAALIQANIGDFDKIASERGVRGAAEKVMTTYFQLSAEALAQTPKPDLLIWPETAYPSTFRTPQSSRELERDHLVERFVGESNVPLLFGGYDHLGTKDYNSLFVLTPPNWPKTKEQAKNASINGENADLQVYHKNNLLLFGEYIPGAEYFPIIKKTFPQVGNFGRGPGPIVMELALKNPGLPSVRFGPNICYEAIFPNYVLGAAKQGSQVILNITNDSWFGPYQEPYLHLISHSFRAVEARLPLIRSTNTGISALVLQDGSMPRSSTINEAQVLNISVPLLDPPWTLMRALGEWCGPFCFFLSLIFCAWIWRNSSKAHPQS